MVLVGGGVDGTETAGLLRASGVPVLHLVDDLPEPEAVAYARSVEAGWVVYPGGDDGAVEMAPVREDAPREVLRVEEVAGKVRGEARRREKRGVAR